MTLKRAIRIAAALFALTVPSTASADLHVLDVGDSHTWLAGAHPPAWQVDARPGRNSTKGLSVLRARLRGRHDEVVFDLATNDRGQVNAFRSNVNAVWDEIGAQRDLTLVTTYVPYDPGSADGVNGVLERFSARHPQRVELVEWEDAARARPEWDGGDGVHFNTAGYEARKSMIREAVRAGRF